MLGRCDSSIGTRSVILLEAVTFNAGSREPAFSVEDALTLNVGSTKATVAVLSARRPNVPDGNISNTVATLSKGDQEFIDLCKELLDPPMQKAAEALLAGVRQRSPGDLKRGQNRNFQETPDNFRYVIVQPRIQELSITVRGPESHFAGATHLPVKDDRGNTRFKVTREDDVAAALSLIFRARRKI